MDEVITDFFLSFFLSIFSRFQKERESQEFCGHGSSSNELLLQAFAISGPLPILPCKSSSRDFYFSLLTSQVICKLTDLFLSSKSVHDDPCFVFLLSKEDGLEVMHYLE